MTDSVPVRQSILNYTTTIGVEQTVAEITRLLAQAKAQAILTEFDEGMVSALSFRIKTEFGVLTFRLPARVEQVYRVLARNPKIPPRLRTKDQAARVAWRIIKDWLEAQLAMIEAGLVDLEQVFLPYAQNA
ncbi:MAG TPA: hypothetical protein VGD78_14365, partial [Chthoniobacterales bacterium]